jgi:Flp pilus assembly protein TadD
LAKLRLLPVAKTRRTKDSQIQEHPTAQAYLGAGINLARLEAYSRALPLLRVGIRLDPDNSQAHYDLALTQFRRAHKELRQAPGSEQAREWLRETVEHARRTTELKPDHAGAFLFWGWALKLLGEPAKAVEPLRRGVVCGPENLDLQLLLGEALLESGQDQEAETYLENARKLDPKDPRPAKDLERVRRKKN